MGLLPCVHGIGLSSLRGESKYFRERTSHTVAFLATSPTSQNYAGAVPPPPCAVIALAVFPLLVVIAPAVFPPPIPITVAAIVPPADIAVAAVAPPGAIICELDINTHITAK